MRKKLPKVSSIRKKCDDLLTPIIKSMFPRCMLCNEETQVAHHFVHKSKSTRLRYEIDNLINLCHKCHQRLHNNESYEAGRIINIKGIEWFKDIERKKNEIVKADVHYYISNFNRLNQFYEQHRTNN